MENNTPVQPQLYDAQTGAPLSLSFEEIPKAIAAGKAAFVKGTQIPVLNPDGTAGTIPSEEAQSAFSQGYQYEPLASQKDRALSHEYGDGIINPTVAGALGAARGATLGLSDLALTKSGLVHPETISNYKKYNPGISLGSDIAGAALPIVLTGGAAGAAEGAAEGASLLKTAAEFAPSSLVAKLGTGVAEGAGKMIGAQGAQTLAKKAVLGAASKGVGSAVEGALFGAGNAVSEDAIGDSDLTAEHLLSSVGLGAALGGGLGVAVGSAEPAISALLSKEHPEQAILSHAAHADTISEQARAAPKPGLFDGGFQDIADQVKGVDFQGLGVELPSRQVLLEAADRTPMQFPPNRLQVESLSNPQVRDQYKAFLEGQSDDALNLQRYEAAQKKEAVNLTHQTIKSVSPTGEVTADAVQNGEKAIKAFSEHYEAEKKELAPLFKQFDDAAAKTKANAPDLIEKLTEAVPSIDTILEVGEDGLKLKPYDPSFPVGRNVYNAVKDVVQSADNEDLTISGIRNLRDNLSDHASKLSGNPKDLAQIGRIKKSLMDYMQNRVAELEPNSNVRELFKRYAINEENRGVIERIFGGSISDRANFAKEIKPENVVDRIMSSTNSVEAAKEILGKEKFNQILADHLAEQAEKVTDKGAFSSNKFASYLKRNQDALAVAFRDSPDQLQKLTDLTDIMRILPDSPSVNPSGTAKTLSLMQRVAKVGSALKSPGTEIPKFVGGKLEKFGNYFENAKTKAELEGVLKGQESIAARTRLYTGLKNLENLVNKGTSEVANAVKAFVTGSKSALVKSSVPASVMYLSTTNFDGAQRKKPTDDRVAFFNKRADEITKAVSNPEQFSDQVANNLKSLQEIAPKAAEAATVKAVQAAHFLYDKMPKDPNSNYGISPLLKKWKPSDAAMAKWERYVTAVDNPMSILKDLKSGVLTRESVEAVKSIYPSLYSQITGQLTEHLSDLKENLPYQKRLMLSNFFGVPIDASADPKFVAKMQTLHLEANHPKPMQGSGINLGGAHQMNLAQSKQTETEKVLSRGQ